MFGSYNKFHNKINIDAAVVSSLDFITSLIASCVIFSVLGFLSQEIGIPVEHVADGGQGWATSTPTTYTSILNFKKYRFIYVAGLEKVHKSWISNKKQFKFIDECHVEPYLSRALLLWCTQRRCHGCLCLGSGPSSSSSCSSSSDSTRNSRSLRPHLPLFTTDIQSCETTR